MSTLTVLSYNVRSLRDDVDALARVVRSVKPDVVLVQEAPRFLRWRMHCAALARHCGLVVVGGGRRAGANLILSSLGVTVGRTAELSFSADKNLHHRGAAVARLSKDGNEFVVAGTHLDLIEAPRLRHLDELAAALPDFTSVPGGSLVPGPVPIIVGGDLNAVEGSRTWQRLLDFGVDVFDVAGMGPGGTYPSSSPVRRIDALFCSPALRPLRAEVLSGPDVALASDHRPLLVELEFSKPIG